MGQVVVNVNGRSYRFDCGDGEEPRLGEIADFVKARIDSLTQQYGRAGSERLLLMAALLITDELMDARAALAEKDAGKPKGDAQAKPQPEAETLEREQDAIRSEPIASKHGRRATADSDI
jgi:cell division protein ZapA